MSAINRPSRYGFYGDDSILGYSLGTQDSGLWVLKQAHGGEPEAGRLGCLRLETVSSGTKP